MSILKKLFKRTRSVIQITTKLLTRFREKPIPPDQGRPIEGRATMIDGVATYSQIRPLKDSVILYMDESTESREARDLLQSVGIKPFITDGPVEPLDRKPLVIYHGGFYRGLQEIRQLVDLLNFWNSQPSPENHTVFRAGD